MYRVVAAAPLLVFLAATAHAQTVPTGGVGVDASVTLTSDYRFRGISRSDRAPAVQASATVAQASGLYVGVFISTIGRYVVDDANSEIDLYGGVRKTVAGTDVDAGVLYYVYPGTNGFTGDYFEPYASATKTIGPASIRVGGNASWKQRGLGVDPGERRSGIYAYGELATAVPTTPVTVTAHLGHSFHATYATFDERYTDWSLAAAYVHRKLTLSIAYVDTDKDVRRYPLGGRDRDIGGAGALISLGVAF